MHLNIDDLLNLDETKHAVLFEDITYSWEVLPRIVLYANDHATGDIQGGVHPTAIIDDNVSIGKGTVVGPHAVIMGPSIIGTNCEIRPGAYIRGNALIGDNCIVGNSTEVKNALLFNFASVPHFNYVGDSILGYKAHFGGGAVTSNYRSDGGEITIKFNDELVNTGLRKFGAIIGDRAELGTNTVLNPGTIIGADAMIYPGAIVRGYIPKNHIVKVRQEQDIVAKH